MAPAAATVDSYGTGESGSSTTETTVTPWPCARCPVARAARTCSSPPNGAGAATWAIDNAGLLDFAITGPGLEQGERHGAAAESPQGRRLRRTRDRDGSQPTRHTLLGSCNKRKPAGSRCRGHIEACSLLPDRLAAPDGGPLAMNIILREIS